jgi:heme-degrading monooxygenase HmoA
MTVRIWRGAVAKSDGDAVRALYERHRVAGYASSEGNRGVWMLRRDVDDKTEFVMFMLWESIDAVKAFAGERPEVAVFYPEDDRYPIERDEFVLRFEVDTRIPA